MVGCNSQYLLSNFMCVTFVGASAASLCIVRQKHGANPYIKSLKNHCVW